MKEREYDKTKYIMEQRQYVHGESMTDPRAFMCKLREYSK